MNVSPPAEGHHMRLKIEDEEHIVSEGKNTLNASNGRSYLVTITEVFSAPPKAYKDKDWLVKAYVTEGLTLQEIADACECSAMTINQWLRKHGIPSRPRGRRSA